MRVAVHRMCSFFVLPLSSKPCAGQEGGFGVCLFSLQLVVMTHFDKMHSAPEFPSVCAVPRSTNPCKSLRERGSSASQGCSH